MIDISIVIVTYNSAKQIATLLSSIAKSADKLSKEIIIIDNASSDQTLKKIKEHKLKLKLVEGKTNQGFSKSVNQAIKLSTGNYILLLNPDTKLLPSSIALLYEFAITHPALGAVCPRLLNMNKKPQASVYKFPTIINAILRYFFGFKTFYDKYLPKTTTKIDVGIMAAMLIPKSVLEKVGLLDERFFLYYEDIEFCARLKKFKFPVYYYPKAKVMHVHGASGNFKSHHQSPLLKSAHIYHGRLYSDLLNLTLFIGQKWQKILKLISLPFHRS